MKPNSQTAVLFSVLVGVVALSGQPVAAQQQQPPADTAELVQQLGHSEYSRREAAAAQLTSLGLHARDHLVAGLQAEDPEIRRRCHRILARAIEADYRRRIAAMLADRAGGEHDLPGWAWYRHAIGNDDDARSLFAAMLLAEPGLFAAAEQGPQLAEEAFKIRFTQLRQEQNLPDREARRQPNVASVAALLLVATNPQWCLPEPLANQMHLVNFARTDGFAAMIERGRFRTAIRRLLGHWMLISDTPNIVHQKLRLALQYEIREGLPLALALLEESETRPPNMAAFATEAVARLGGKQYLATLLPLLEDQRQCARAGKRVIEVRDVVLAWLVYTTGQDLDEYGQATAKGWFHTLAQKPGIMFHFSRFGYESAELRSEALNRWADWIEANPLAQAPESSHHLVVDRPAEQASEPPTMSRPTLSDPGGLTLADRILVRRLHDAEQLALQKDFSLAAREFGRLLTLQSDFYYQPDRNVPVFRHLKSAAEKAIGQLPAEGLAAYQLVYGAEAQRRLDEAVRDNDRIQLARVSQSYFHTAAGAEAMYLLGADYWQAGQWFSAAACWQRLIDSGNRTQRFEPALSIQLAACWLALGEPWRVAPRLESLKASSRGGPIAIGRREVPWFGRTDDATGWLTAVLGRQPMMNEPAWPVARGRPSRNPITESSSPYLASEPLDSIPVESSLHDTIRDMYREHIVRRRAMLPTLQPLVFHDTILYRDTAHVRAVRIGSGQLLWKATPEDALVDLLAPSTEDGLSEKLPPAELLYRLWQNPACGKLSSDGRFVFAVERLPIKSGIQPQRMILHRDGTRHLDHNGNETMSSLAAYDVTTGKLRWEAGGPTDDEGRVLAGVSFLGPPLPLGANVYCIASANEKTALVALDAATGTVQWQRVLAVRDEAIPVQEDAMMGPDGPQPSGPSHTNGISPSLADGTLVCPIPGDQVVAVDLTSRSIVWLYRGHGASPDNAANGRAVNSVVPHTDETSHDQWVDVCVTAVGEHVLMTPAGSDRLISLRLSDGVEQWTAPRGDGLYVGGVYDNLVLIVGRSGIRALQLADGKPAWKNELALPPGAMPSGRGYLSQGRLYVPLTTAEVLGVDVTSGHIASRSRSPAKVIPGNLVGLGHCVVSQNCLGLWQFDLAADQEAQAAKHVEQTPNSAAAWAERGELLLCDGRIAEAVECLSQACRLEPAPAFRLRLARAVTDGLWADYGQFHPWIDDLDWQGMEPGHQAGILRAIGWSAQRAGDRTTALDAFLALAKVDPAGEAVQPLSAAVRVRRDRWLAARLDELLRDADSVHREAVAERFASLADEALVRYLPFHPVSVDARIRLSMRQESGPLTSEQLLRAALQFAAPEVASTPVKKLAEFHYQRNRARDATRWMALLERLSAEAAPEQQPPTPGARVTPPPTSIRFDVTQRPLWPSDALQVNTERRDGRQAITCPVPVQVHMVDPSFDRQANVRVENMGRKLYGYDNLGRQTWELPLSPMKQPVRFRNGHYLAEGAQLGRILVVWLVNRVCAIDLSGEVPRLLWDYKTTDLGAGGPSQRHHVQRANRRRNRQSDAFVPWGPLLVAHGYACFVCNEELVAVDLQSGAFLWARDDIPIGTDLFGDARYIFVVSAESPGVARVLNALDGGELGQRNLPTSSDCLTAIGRRLLICKDDASSRRLQLIDPWNDETVWERALAVDARVCLVQPDGVATLDSLGHFAVWQTDSGEPFVESHLGKLPALESIHIESYGTDLLVFANHPPDPEAKQFSSRPVMPAVDANGTLYRISPNGQVVWNTEIIDQQLELDLPPELPVLLLSKQRRQKTTRPDGRNITKTEYAVLCIDKRTGQTLHDQTVSSQGQELDLHAVDPKGGRIEVLTRPLSIQITRVKESP